VEIYRKHHLKIMMIVLGLIVLLTTLWSSLDSVDFQNRSLQNLGGIAFGVMVLTFGLKVDDTHRSKAAQVSGFILVIGTAFATREFCNLAGQWSAEGLNFTANVLLPAIGVIMGFVLSGSSDYVTGRKKSRSNKIIWMLVVFSFAAICALMLYRTVDIMQYFGTTLAFYAVFIEYICYIIIFAYGLYSMFSDEIRYNMTIGVTPPDDAEA